MQCIKSDVKAVSQPVDAEKEIGLEILFSIFKHVVLGINCGLNPQSAKQNCSRRHFYYFYFYNFEENRA